MQQLLLPLFSPRPAMTVEEIARCPQNDILKVRCYELRKLKVFIANSFIRSFFIEYKLIRLSKSRVLLQSSQGDVIQLSQLKG